MGATGHSEVVLEKPPLAYREAVRALTGCFANTARLIWQRRMHPPAQRVGMRPDGYIGFRGQTADPGQLTTWLARIRVPA